MTKEETVEFARKHIYGGHKFNAGDKLTLPAHKAADLRKAGALKAEKKAKAKAGG